MGKLPRKAHSTDVRPHEKSFPMPGDTGMSDFPFTPRSLVAESRPLSQYSFSLN